MACDVAPECAFDFSGAEAVLRLSQSSAATTAEAIDELIGSRGYQAFLAYHSRHLDEQRFRSELVALKNSNGASVDRLAGWIPVVREPERLSEIVRRLRDNRLRLIAEIFGDLFPWLPTLYMSQVKVLFLVDGMAVGYRVGNDWTCDLSCACSSKSDPYIMARAQLFHILGSHQLDLYFAELWWQYRDKCCGAAEMYTLWVLVQLMERGLLHFLVQQGGYTCGSDAPADDASVGTAAQRHRVLHEFLVGLETTEEPRTYFQEHVARFQEGAFDHFQILGSFMCSTLVNHCGRDELVRCLSNPPDFYARCQQAWADMGISTVFDPALIPNVSTRPIADSQQKFHFSDVQVPALAPGPRILACAGPAPAAFCILFRDAGSLAGRSHGPGVAHFAEHCLIHLIKHHVPGLSSLKGTTDHFHGIVSASYWGAGPDPFHRTLRILQSPGALDAGLVETVRQTVLAEIGAVSANPFFMLQERLCGLAVADYDSIRGTADDVREITVLMLQRFAASHYRLSGALAVVYGPLADQIRTVHLPLPPATDVDAPYAAVRREYSNLGNSTHVTWDDQSRIITTCVAGFVYQTNPQFAAIDEYLIRKYIGYCVALCQNGDSDTAHCKAFVEIKNFRTFGLITLNCQGYREPIIALLRHVLAIVATSDTAEVEGLFHDWCRSRAGRRQRNVSGDSVALATAVAIEYVDTGSLAPSFVFPCNDPNVDLSTLIGRIRAAVCADGMYLSGNGPEEILNSHL